MAAARAGDGLQLFICMSTAFSAALAGAEAPASKAGTCPSTVDWGPAFPFDVVAVAFFYYSVYLLVLRRFLVHPLGSLLVYVLAPWDPKNRAVDGRKARSVTKFVAGIMQLVDKAYFSYAGLALLTNQPWAWPSRQWWSIPPRLESAGAFFLVAVVARRLLEALFAYTDRVDDDDVRWTMACSTGAACMVGAALYTGAVRIAFVLVVLNDVAPPLLGLAQALAALCDVCAADFARVRYALALLANVLYGYGAVVFFLARVAAMTYVVVSASAEAEAKPQWLAVGLLYAVQWFEFRRLLRSVVARVVHGAPVAENANKIE